MPHPLPALIVVDVQRAFDEWEAAGKRRNNPDAVARIVDLLAAFRASGAPIFHIRHEGAKPNSSFLPTRTGYAVKNEAREQASEPVIVKRVNSAFIGTESAGLSEVRASTVQINFFPETFRLADNSCKNLEKISLSSRPNR